MIDRRVMRKTNKGLLFPEVIVSFVKIEVLIAYLTNFLGGCSHNVLKHNKRFKMEIHLPF